MGFKPISIDKYVKLQLKTNPSIKEDDLRKRINQALKNYKNGVKCSCGEDIWVIGSAAAGNSCFTCIIGESPTKTDLEIDTAIKKLENKSGRTHINDIDPLKSMEFLMMKVMKSI